MSKLHSVFSKFVFCKEIGNKKAVWRDRPWFGRTLVGPQVLSDTTDDVGISPQLGLHASDCKFWEKLGTQLSTVVQIS